LCFGWEEEKAEPGNDGMTNDTAMLGRMLALKDGEYPKEFKKASR
jgi:hypothetical protein